MNSGACFGFKYNSNFCFIFISLVAYTWQAKRVAQLVSCFVGNHKVPGSNPWRTKTFFLPLVLFHFFIKLHQFIWPIKTSHFEMIFCTLVIWYVYFVIMQKNSKNILFLIIFHLFENKSFLWLKNHFSFDFFCQKFLTNSFLINQGTKTLNGHPLRCKPQPFV